MKKIRKEKSFYRVELFIGGKWMKSKKINNTLPRMFNDFGEIKKFEEQLLEVVKSGKEIPNIRILDKNDKVVKEMSTSYFEKKIVDSVEKS